MVEAENNEFELNEALLNYFSIADTDMESLDRRELNSLNHISSEILDWDPDGDGKNIFLVDSYAESKRNTAAAYIAKRIYSQGRGIALVRTARDLKSKNLKPIKGNKTGFIFINYQDGGPISRKQIQKILLSIGKRRIRKIPVILSVPNAFSELIRGDESSISVRYPQNRLSRAFVMLAISAIVLPLYNFPYMQIPLGTGEAINDAGMVSLLLFLYALALIFSSRRMITWRNYASIAIAITLFVLLDLIILFTPQSITYLISTPLNVYPPIEIFNPGSYYSNLRVYFPVLLKLASFAVFPLGFAQKSRRKYVYIAYAVSVASFYLALQLLSGLPLGGFLSTHVAAFQNQYPPMETYLTYMGNPFQEALAGIPPAAIFFSLYLAISQDLKSRFSIPLEDTSEQPAGS